MQLGELQHQIARFERRGASIIALSVDTPTDSLAMTERLGLTFALGSDPQQQVVQAFRVQNPDTQELALHAVYIVDEQSRIFYRKVARRRPTSNELIDAIDAHRGVYPQSDTAAPRQRINVAYPQNEFQALLEIAAVEQLPPSVDPQAIRQVIELLESRQIDEAMLAFRDYCRANQQIAAKALLDSAAWIIRQLMYAERPEPITAGKRLRTQLDSVAELEGQSPGDAAAKDAALHALAGARARLAATRANISNNTQAWQLRFAKAHLRSYREVVHASRR